MKLNIQQFNRKEHAAIIIMTAASSSTPEAMSVLAVQKLWYNIRPNTAIGIFLILSTQMVGYGVAGILRSTLVYPSKMFYPANLPTASLIENLHKDRKTTQKRMKVFWIAFIILFCWQGENILSFSRKKAYGTTAFPQYIAPVLAGVSIFCLTHQHSLLVTHIFGGSMANEGLGLLSFSFDWTMIAGGGNPMYMPFQTLMNSLAGYTISIGLYVGLYYSDHWRARSFPFLSPQMFSETSTAQKYESYNQTAILNQNFRVDPLKLSKYGLPYLTSSHAFGMSVRNIGIMASIGHMALWHWDDIKTAFQLFSWDRLKKIGNAKTINWKFWQHRGHKLTHEEADDICPHYGLMQAYEEVPSSWFGVVWLISAAVGLICSTMAGSTLPWWAFFLALVISAFCLPFFGALTAMFGFQLMVQPLIQMIGAYILPGLPVANMCKFPVHLLMAFVRLTLYRFQHVRIQ
jgi:OPT family oligopeptide transporter